MNALALGIPRRFDPSVQAVEVFRTDVDSAAQAAMVINALHNACSDLTASFDLEDCDRVLCLRGRLGRTVWWDQPLKVLRRLGIRVEALPD